MHGRPGSILGTSLCVMRPGIDLGGPMTARRRAVGLSGSVAGDIGHDPGKALVRALS